MTGPKATGPKAIGPRTTRTAATGLPRRPLAAATLREAHPNA